LGRPPVCRSIAVARAAPALPISLGDLGQRQIEQLVDDDPIDARRLRLGVGLLFDIDQARLEEAGKQPLHLALGNLASGGESRLGPRINRLAVVIAPLGQE
jgi:hypothetical protein